MPTWPFYRLFLIMKPAAIITWRDVTERYMSQPNSPHSLPKFNWKRTIEKQNYEEIQGGQRNRPRTQTWRKVNSSPTWAMKFATPWTRSLACRLFCTSNGSDSKQRNYIEKVSLFGESLAEHYNDILDFSKSKRAKWTLKNVPFTLQTSSWCGDHFRAKSRRKKN